MEIVQGHQGSGSAAGQELWESEAEGLLLSWLGMEAQRASSAEGAMPHS
jgi:hypothetical protein